MYTDFESALFTFNDIYWVFLVVLNAEDNAQILGLSLF